MIQGNTKTRERILQLAETKKLTHALLLSGPKGTEKFSFLCQIGKKLVGEKTLPPNIIFVDELYIEGVNSDLEQLAKKSSFNQSHRKKLKKKSDTIGVDDLEAFTKHLHETVDGDWKILCIRDIERMTIAASNKFLKILEEPPEKTLFLMTTSEERKLLSTITSRVQKEHFSLLSRKDAEKIISEHAHSFSKSDIDSILLLSAGRETKVKEYIQNPELFNEELNFFEEIKNFHASSKLEKMQYAEKLVKESIEKIFHFLLFYSLYLRRNLQDLMIENQKEKLQHIETLLSKIFEAKKNIQKNGNKRLILESLFIS